MRVALVCLADPFAKRNGASLRLRSLIRSLELISDDLHVVFPPGRMPDERSRDVHSEHHVDVGRDIKREALNALRGVKRAFLPMPTMRGGRHPDVRARLEHLEPQVVVVTALSLLSNLDSAPAYKVWIDYLDLWSDFGMVEARSRRGVTRLSAYLQAKYIGQLEKRWERRADLVTAVGWQDVTKLTARGTRAHWLPVALPDEEFSAPAATTKQKCVGYIADFAYWPNRDAWTMFMKFWQPQLKAQGFAVVAAGHDVQKYVHETNGVQVLTDVQDVNDFYRMIDLSVAPIRRGGGMKVKVLESLSRGIPVIVSDAAAEGFPPSLDPLLTQASLHAGGKFTTIDPSSHFDPLRSELDPFRQSHQDYQVRLLVAGI